MPKYVELSAKAEIQTQDGAVLHSSGMSPIIGKAPLKIEALLTGKKNTQDLISPKTTK